MSDVGEFFLGNIIAGAGIALSVLTGGVLSSVGLAIASIGFGMMSRGLGITGRPSRVAAQQSTYDPTATLKVVYGRTWVGLTGADIWVDHDDVSDHQSLWTFGVFSVGSENGQGVEDVEQIKIDGIKAVDPVTTGSQTNTTAGTTSFFTKSGDDLLSYNVRLGTDAQGVNTDAQGAANNASDRYPNSFRFRGLCYAAFNLWKHKDVFPNFPRSISALVKGVRVYDPRNPSDGPDNDGWIWDDADTSASLNQPPGQNPALILLDLLTSKRYGAEAFYPERDGGDTSLSEIDEQSFIDGANTCDELVQDGDGGTQPRFSFNDWLDTGNTLIDNIQAILSSMRGVLVMQEGTFRLVIPQTQSSVMTLSEDDIIGDWSFRRAGQNEVPNRVVATIPERQGETATEIQFPDEDDTTFLDQDGGVPQIREIPLYGVDDPVRAEQIAMVALREAREDVTIQFRATERAAELEVGDVFTLDHAFPGWQGGSAKDFRAIALTLRPDFTVEVTATEYAASAYSLSSQTRPTPPPGSSLPDPTSTNAPSNLALTSDATTQTRTPAGDKTPGILATWDLPTDKGIDRAVVVERENGASTWNTADVVDPTDTQRSLFRPQGGSEADTWEVGVYVLVGQRLLKSSVTTATVTLDTDYDPSNDLPSAVNLLGEDAGPEHSGTGSPIFYQYSGFEEGAGSGKQLSALNLEPGDVVSARFEMRTATGTDSAFVRLRFRDSGGTILSNANTNTITSSTYEGSLVEDVSIPANAVEVSVMARNQDGTEEAFVRRAMLNRGPVAAPYTDPPPQDAENLLPFSALPEDSHTGSSETIHDDLALSDLGLSVGDIISGRRQVKSATGADRVRYQIRFKDSGDSTISTADGSEVTSSTYEDSVIHGEVIPATTDHLHIVVQNLDATEGFSSKWGMLNRGPRAAPFQPPNFKEFLDDIGSIWRDVGTQSTRLREVVQKLTDGGDGDSGFRIGGFGPNRHTETGINQNGDTDIPFSNDYENAPEITFTPQSGLSFSTSDSGSDHKIDMRATNKTVSKFDLKAVLKTSQESTTAVTDGFSASQNAAAPENGDVTLSSAGDAAYSNLEDANTAETTYTAYFDVDTTGLSGGRLATVFLETNDSTGGTSWTQRASASYSPGENLSDESLSFTAQQGADFDLRLRLALSQFGDGTPTITAHGEDNAQPGVEYDKVTSSPTENSMTPASQDRIAWEAKEVA